MTGADGIALRDLLRSMLEEAGLDYMAALIPTNARAFIHITLVVFDTKNEQQARSAYDVCRTLVVRVGQARVRRVPRAPGTSWTSPPSSTPFNDHAYMRFCETVKDALDPNGILSRPASRGSGPRVCGRRRASLSRQRRGSSARDAMPSFP